MAGSGDDKEMDHRHEVSTREEKPIRAMHGKPDGSIALELCNCGALRSVINQGGKITESDWELPDEEEMPLPWDGTTDNDNE